MTEISAASPRGDATEGDMSLASRTARGAMVCALFLATLWDFRIADIRVFDGAAFAILLVLIAAAAWRKRLIRPSPGVALLTGVFALYALYGFVAIHHKSSLGIIVGCLVLLSLASLRRDLVAAARWLPRIAWIHIAAFALQMAAFHLRGKVFDYHALYGAHSHIYAGYQQSFCGLFREPNSYCLTLFMLLMLCALVQRARGLVFVGALSMALSQSLWGDGAAVVAIVFHEWRWGSFSRAAALAAALNIVVIGGLTAGYMWLTIPQGYYYPLMYIRLRDIATDTSLYQRYIVNRPVEAGHLESMAPSKLPPAPVDWAYRAKFVVGSGLSTEYFLAELPANGFFLVGKSFGIVGSVLLLLALAKSLAPVPRSGRWAAATSIAVTLTTYPLFTYLLFWLWLGLLLLPAQEPD